MNKYKQRIQSLRRVSPEYPRIPHLDKSISQMTHDDILAEGADTYPINCFVEEKIDGANMGVSWKNGGPILRNRNNILKKGYSEIKTPAKEQFKSAWNWVHEHHRDIQLISSTLMSDVTIYGDWLVFQHSINYDQLPDWFIAYDIWVVAEHKFLAPDRRAELLARTKIAYVQPQKVILHNKEEVTCYAEMPSTYRTGIREGIVLKTAADGYQKDMYKVVNKHFIQRQDFNENIIRNKLIYRS